MGEKNQSGVVIVGVKEGYEAKVALEALKRVGRNPQIKGVAHEIMIRDSYNVNPLNILA